MQELAVGSACVDVHLGNKRISYADLIKVIRHFVQSQPGHWSEHTDEFGWPTLHRVTFNMSQLYHRIWMSDMVQVLGIDGSYPEDFIDWQSWIQYSSLAEASDDRDRVYASRNMLPIMMGIQMKIDYSLSVEQVFEEFANLLSLKLPVLTRFSVGILLLVQHSRPGFQILEI
jgi:hypothetical protein